MEQSIDQRLYRLMTDMGDEKVRDRLDQLVKSKKSSQTALGSHLIAEAGFKILPELEKLTRKKRTIRQRRVAQMIKEVGARKIAAIGLKTILNELHSSRFLDGSTFSMQRKPLSVQALQTMVGVRIKREADYVAACKEAPEATDYLKRRMRLVSSEVAERGYRKILSAMAGGVDSGWSREDTKIIGAIVVELIQTCTDLLFVNNSAKTPDRWGIVRWTQEVRLADWVADWWAKGAEALSVVTAINLPITEPPLDWHPDGSGGYPTESGKTVRLIGRARKEQLKAFRQSDCPELLKALNTLQRTGWRVNRRVLEVFRTAYRNEWYDVGMGPP